MCTKNLHRNMHNDIHSAHFLMDCEQSHGHGWKGWKRRNISVGELFGELHTPVITKHIREVKWMTGSQVTEAHNKNKMVWVIPFIRNTKIAFRAAQNAPSEKLWGFIHVLSVEITQLFLHTNLIKTDQISLISAYYDVKSQNNSFLILFMFHPFVFTVIKGIQLV